MTIKDPSQRVSVWMEQDGTIGISQAQPERLMEDGTPSKKLVGQRICLDRRDAALVGAFLLRYATEPA